MPKQIEEDYSEEQEAEYLDDDDLEVEEEKKIIRGKPTAKKVAPKTAQSPQTTQVKKPVAKEAPIQMKKRFVAFLNPQQVGIMDAETQEVVGEGEYALLQCMANVIERLERIENQLGSMMES